MAKAEWITGTWDNDAVKPYLQVNPSGVFGQSKTLQYLIVATDLDGYDDLSAAYADVYHPDGTFKYQVALSNVVSCTDNVADLATWKAKLTDAYNRNLVKFVANMTLV